MASAYTTKKGLRWRATWTVDGIQASRGQFVSEPEAQAYENRMRAEKLLDQMGPAGIEERSRTTALGDWLTIWWETHVAHLTLNTRESYAESVNECIAPYLLNVPLYALTQPRIVRWKDDMLRDGVTAHKATAAMSVLSAALTRAKEAGYTLDNHALGAPRPKRAPKPMVDPLTPEDVERVRLAILRRPRRGRFDDLDALRSATVVSVLAYGGLRPEDCWGLRACDVDVESGGIWVRGVMAAEYRADDTKTHTGGRFVDLPAPVMEDLHQYLDASGLTGWSWLFPDESGGVSRWTHRNWNERVWRRARREAAKTAPDPVTAKRITTCTPYRLRHACVSVIARAEGTDLDWADLAARMGHGLDVMRRTYLHVVRASRNRTRVPVATQILEARKKLDIEGATATTLTALPKPPKLIDLTLYRARRPAA